MLLLEKKCVLNILLLLEIYLVYRRMNKSFEYPLKNIYL